MMKTVMLSCSWWEEMTCIQSDRRLLNVDMLMYAVNNTKSSSSTRLPHEDTWGGIQDNQAPFVFSACYCTQSSVYSQWTSTKTAMQGIINGSSLFECVHCHCCYSKVVIIAAPLLLSVLANINMWPVGLHDLFFSSSTLYFINCLWGDTKHYWCDNFWEAPLRWYLSNKRGSHFYRLNNCCFSKMLAVRRLSPWAWISLFIGRPLRTS